MDPASELLRRFDPLRFCPAEKHERYAARAELAASRPKAAIITKCLECCAWERREVRRCTIATCALYALSVRYFGRDDAEAIEQGGAVDG